MRRQTLSITLVLSVDADLAGELPGRPGRDWGGDRWDEPASGISLAAEELADRLLDLAAETLAPIAAERGHASASVGRPWDASLEAF